MLAITGRGGATLTPPAAARRGRPPSLGRETSAVRPRPTRRAGTHTPRGHSPSTRVSTGPYRLVRLGGGRAGGPAGVSVSCMPSRLRAGTDSHLRITRGIHHPDAPVAHVPPTCSECLGGGFTMPRTVRDFTKSPIAVISHSPENCLISLAIITPVCGLGAGEVEADQLLAGRRRRSAGSRPWRPR